MEFVVAENNNQTSEIAMMRNVSLDKDDMLTLGKMINNISNVINVRLVNGSTWTEGRVEVFYNGEWGTVCNDTWTDENAHVICRQFGYFSGVPFPAAKFGKGEGRIWLDDVDCEGSESNIFDCAHDSIGTHNCGHHKDAGVSCMKSARCGDGWLTFGQSCYLFKHYKKDWTTAQSDCVQLGAKLVEVETADEDNFLIDEISKQIFSGQIPPYWTGGNAIEKSGNFMWSRSRSLFSNMYTNWSPGQPNNVEEECVGYVRNEWHDYSCSFPFFFICERVMF